MGGDLGGLLSSVNRQMELVSVVIPCYNSGATLGQMLESVRAQTWPHVEIIIVDDGSTDPQTLSLLHSLVGVTLVRQANAGLPAARNAGFCAARGEYVLPLDADDWLEPETIMLLLQALKASPTADFAFCDARLEGEASGRLHKNYNYFEQLFLNQLPYCLLMPKQLWEEVGGYDATLRQGYEDWEFNIRLGRHGHHGLRIAQPLFHYRVSSSGMLISKSNRLHGLLWSEIQARHRSVYKPINLYRLWREWADKPSHYPLALYFIWFGLHRLLPASAFSMLFKYLRVRTHHRRSSSAS